MRTPEPGAAAPRTRVDYRVKAAILALLIGAGIVLAITVDLPDPAALRDRVAAAGTWGMLAFILLYAALTLTPFPASALTIASGLLFGLAIGASVVVFAATLGAWLAFLLARSLGRDGVSRIRWARFASVDAMLERRGLVSVLIVRLVPLFPFMAVNYAAGLSAVRQRDYLLGTAVGIVPATVGYTALGAYGTSPLSWPFAIAVLAVVVITVTAAYAARRINTTAMTNSGHDASGDDPEGDAGDVRRLPA
ncbi:MAG: TVP38/TMEM64 family protein [Proteobacteria bacterium]|nr:TVP38/TMEM64 family protein [Actinomycetes bacterium]MCH9712580.1 TVP38/TMEM64 family protein [Pseudomonadota bacterium]MCH9762349.1 TVP38/TMEM64 family protein [Actinomycetes bacterium]